MRACLFAVAGLSVAAAAAASTASIELLPRAVVSGDAVVLGQVAHLRSTDLELMRKLVDLPIARAPKAGYQATVDRAQVDASIGRVPGLGASRVEWSGATETRLVREFTRVRGEDIANVAVQEVLGNLAGSGVSAPDLHVPAVPRDLEVPGGAVRLQARPLASVRLRARTLVWVDVWSGTAHVRTVAVPIEGGGAEARATETAPPPRRVADRAERNDAKGVTRGQWASLRTTAGVVALESRVEVLQDGRQGEKVRVRQSGATGVVFAKVVGEGQLELAP